MRSPVDSPYRVPFDESFDLGSAPTSPPDDPGKKACKKALEQAVDRLSDLQGKLYAQDKYSLLLVFQAMDAAGKDSTIRAVMSGINPAGCQVYSFKRPSPEEYDHDFLWRTTVRLPERGRIGIFNRSHYESVLVVRVHPEYLGSEKLPAAAVTETIWDERLESIRDHEKHLARNGTVILKFFLNVSRDEQMARFQARLDDPSKNWKFSRGDLAERELWPDYMAAYQAAMRATSRPWAPWFAIPADDKPYMRMTVADIVARTLESLPLEYPTLSPEELDELAQLRKELATG